MNDKNEKLSERGVCHQYRCNIKNTISVLLANSVPRQSDTRALMHAARSWRSAARPHGRELFVREHYEAKNP